MECTSPVHGASKRAYRRGCRCPEALAAARRNWARRRVPGHLLNAPKSRDPYVDEVAVARACLGERLTLTIAERRRAVQVMTERGLTARLIAVRLRLSERTVVRYRTGSRSQPVDKPCAQTRD